MANYNKLTLKAYDRLGNELIKNGQLFKKKVFDIKKNSIYTIDKAQIINMLKNLGFSSFAFADRTYHYLDLEVMKGIIANDWTDKREYISEKFDCDDYALAFKSHMAEIYLINGIALAKHIKVTLSNGEKIYHRAVVFLAKDKGLISLFLMESQNDNVIQITHNRELALGCWKYILNTIIF